MQKKTVFLIIFILIIILAGSFFGYFYYFKNLKNKIGTEEIVNSGPAIKEYSYKDVIYNFWGIVSAIEGDTLSVNGVIPDPEANLSKLLRQTIKFKVSPNAKIVKLEKTGVGIVPVFISLDKIQVDDVLGLKADSIDVIKKEAVATDILVKIKNPIKNPNQ